MIFNQLIVSFLLLVIFVFPGIFILKRLRELPALDKVIIVPVVSISFWICASWFVSEIKAPLNLLFFCLQLTFLLLAIMIFRKDLIKLNLKKLIAIFAKLKVHQYALFCALILYLFPFATMTIPPGCDISMHGYITRLIINNNGLPVTYDPIIPGNHFGSYSAGYHILTALVSGVSTSFLRESINLVSVAVYPLALLCIVYLFKQFFSERTAVYTAIVTFSINSSLQSTIGWGGNPTILALGFCLFVTGAVLFAVKNTDTFIFRLCALPLAVIPLVHAIPAITFFYLSVLGYAILVAFNREIIRWILLNTFYMSLYTIVLLLPFAVHFRNETSPELTEMIRTWQNEMMNSGLSDNLGKNISVVYDQIVLRAGNTLVIISLIALAALLVYKKYRPVALIVAFELFIFLLVLNSAYWVLPLSEILYPERVMFFMIICLGIPIGLLFDLMDQSGFKITLKKYPVYISSFIIFFLCVIGASRYWNGYTLSILRNNKIKCNPQTMAAFAWIEQHTETNAIVKCTYADAGIWTPAFSNRATIGAHLHFIHEVLNVNPSLEKQNRPQYFMITNRDTKDSTGILQQVEGKHIVFSNDEVKIYH